MFDGCAGCGKTTLANAVANEMGVDILLSNGAELRSVKSVLPYIGKLKAGTIWFIDEIHRLTTLVQEYLYPVIEDWVATIGKEEHVKRIQLEPFTLIGATTDSGMLTQPMRDRFPNRYHLKVYETDELTQLVKISAEKLEMVLDDACCESVARRGRGVPRVTNNLLKWVKDFSLAKEVGVSVQCIDDAMKLKGIGPNGLDSNDRKYLNVLKLWDKPCGIKTLASMTNISQETIEEVIEPFLLRKQLVVKTSKGRVLV